MGDNEQKYLVDTGATVSLVSREFISRPLKSCSLSARATGEEDLHALGLTDLNVYRATLSVSRQVLAVSMRNTCILGAGFLKSGVMVMDIASSKLSWQTDEVELIIETIEPTVNKPPA